MSRAPMIAFAALAAILVGSLVVEYHASRSEDDTLAIAPTRALLAIRAQAQPPARADAQAQVDTMLARPMFSPSRRPPPSAAGGTGSATLPRLSAVMVSERGRTVIFAASGNAKPAVLGEGGHIGAYVVQSIGVGQVTVAGPDGIHVLKPMFEGATSAPVVTPVATAPSILDLLRQVTPAVGIPGLPTPTPGTTAAPR